MKRNLQWQDKFGIEGMWRMKESAVKKKRAINEKSYKEKKHLVDK